MSSTPEQPQADKDLDLEAVREVEAAVAHLAERFAQRDPKVSAALQREVHVLRGLLAGHAPASGGARGSLHRLRELYDSVLIEETKDASLLILLNRLLGV
ncbi:MAG TPA: hypothetical protein VH183_02840 [Burkholderiaceae bacterium]|jgi:hypothetical protein|nr:hypothetical protein [Burkholderiaceae bacterium]